MKKYYVTKSNPKAYDQWEEGYTSLSAAINAARDQEYITKRDKSNWTVEVRSYVEDVEDEDCECFDYDPIEFIIRDREAGNIIDWFRNYSEAIKTLAEYEDIDRREGTYTEDFYEIVPVLERYRKDMASER